jgi:hypothetical protein
MTFSPSAGLLNGIINFLFYKYGSGSVFSEGSSRLVDGSNWGDGSLLANPSITGTTHQDDFCSTNIASSSFTAHLVGHLVQLASYSLMAGTSYDSSHPRSWVVDGSMDSVSWSQLHRVENNDSLVGKGNLSHFECDRADIFRHFRFTQTALDSFPRNNFVLHKVELFGKLFDSNFVCSRPPRCLLSKGFLALPVLLFSFLLQHFFDFENFSLFSFLAALAPS